MKLASDDVLIFESSAAGHRLQFISFLIEGLNEIGIFPKLIAPQSVFHSEEYREWKNRDVLHFEGCEINDFPTTSSFARKAQYWIDFANGNQFGYAYLPSGDAIAQHIGLRSAVAGSAARRLMAKCETLLIGGQYGYPHGLSRRVRNRFVAKAFAAHRWSRIFHLDRYQWRWLTRHAKSGFSLMPDPVAPTGSFQISRSRRMLGIPEGGTLIGCTGWIERSKGCDKLIEAFVNEIPHLPLDARLLLAGSFKDGIGQELQQNHGSLLRDQRIIAIDRLLSDDELDWAVQSVDVMCLPYLRANQSSGIFLRSVSAKKPILVHNAGWLKKTVDLLGNGWAVDVYNRQKFSGAIRKAMTGELSRAIVDSPALDEFLDFHSPQNFKATWTQRLCEKRGIEPARFVIEPPFDNQSY